MLYHRVKKGAGKEYELIRKLGSLISIHKTFEIDSINNNNDNALL